MQYVRLKVKFKEYPGKFNRTILVRKDLDLFSLGVCILTSLGATFEHFFLFMDKERNYLPEAFEDLWHEREVFMTDYHYSDLVLNSKKQFTLVYDTGDDWQFVVQEMGEEEISSERLIFLEAGKGQGIWEDNIWSLYQFLSGETEGKTKKELEKEGIHLPWNFVMSDFSDFNIKLPIKALDAEMDDISRGNIKLLKEEGRY